ncbi:hypothetical protein AB205_0155020, partial [Aquarana catesbeiana]
SDKRFLNCSVDCRTPKVLCRFLTTLFIILAFHTLGFMYGHASHHSLCSSRCPPSPSFLQRTYLRPYISSWMWKCFAPGFPRHCCLQHTPAVSPPCALPRPQKRRDGNTLERTGAEFHTCAVYIKHNTRGTYVRSVSGGRRIVSADRSNEDKMVDKFTAPDFLPNFTDKYRELPCLWQVQCRDYLKKQKRKAALDKLLELVKPVYPTADINYLKGKIGSLRSTYNRERKKVQDSLRSGAAADDVYVPRLW